MRADLAAERRSTAIREQEQHMHVAINNEMVTRNRVQVCEERIEALKNSFLETHTRCAILEEWFRRPFLGRVRWLLSGR